MTVGWWNVVRVVRVLLVVPFGGEAERAWVADESAAQAYHTGVT